MSCSIKTFMNKARIGKDGQCSVSVRVIIDKYKMDYATDVRWQASLFDKVTGLCLPRQEGDTECHEVNIIIRSEINKCNEIFRYYRLANIPITIARFRKEYKENVNRNSVAAYMEAKIKSRTVTREISALSAQRHRSTLAKLRTWCPTMTFADFDERWSQSFDSWLKSDIKPIGKEHSPNTRWCHHKNMKVYLNCARKDHIRFIYPYNYFSVSVVAGGWKAIFEKDVVTMYNYYLDNNCPENYRLILRAFLFSCMTGLRVSDMLRIRRDNLMDGILVFIPYKTRKSNYMHKIPLNKMAMALWNDAVAFAEKPELFAYFSEQYSNRELKEIATAVGIKANLHWHVGRHTFISLYYAKTRDLLATKEFAGHKNIKQTMIYTHQNPEEIKEKMKAMDDIG